MELKDLKSVWKKATEQSEPGYWVSTENIRAMIQNKSNNTIAGIKSALKFKIRSSTAGVIIAWTVVVLMLNTNDSPGETYFFGLLDTAQEFAFMMGFMGTVLMTFSIVMRLRYRQIRDYEQSSLTLKESIAKAKTVVKKVIQSGIYSDTFGVTTMVVWISYLKLYDGGFQADVRLLYLILVALTTSALIYIKVRWLQRSKYGHFVKALDGYLDELEIMDLEKNEDDL